MATSAALVAQQGLDTAIERLSTGKRVNSAADDVAGVSIASRLTSEAFGMRQAVENAMHAKSLIETVEGAYQEVENIIR